MPSKKQQKNAEIRFSLNPIQGIDIFVDLSEVIVQYLETLGITTSGWWIEDLSDLGALNRNPDATVDHLLQVSLARDTSVRPKTLSS